MPRPYRDLEPDPFPVLALRRREASSSRATEDVINPHPMIEGPYPDPNGGVAQAITEDGRLLAAARGIVAAIDDELTRQVAMGVSTPVDLKSILWAVVPRMNGMTEPDVAAYVADVRAELDDACGFGMYELEPVDPYAEQFDEQFDGDL